MKHKLFGLVLLAMLAVSSGVAMAVDTADPPSLKQGVANVGATPAQAPAISINKIDYSPAVVWGIKPSEPSCAIASGGFGQIDASPHCTMVQVSGINFVLDVDKNPAYLAVYFSDKLPLPKYDPGLGLMAVFTAFSVRMSGEPHVAFLAPGHCCDIHVT